MAISPFLSLTTPGELELIIGASALSSIEEEAEEEEEEEEEDDDDDDDEEEEDDEEEVPPPSATAMGSEDFRGKLLAALLPEGVVLLSK